MKRLLSVLTAFALVFCLSPLRADAAAGGFTDISDPAVKQAAELLASLDIMNGVGGTQFDPNGTLNRAMLAAIGARIAGVRDVSVYTSTVRFPDVRAGHWAHGWVMAAVDKKIMVGMPDGSFQPGGQMQFQYLVTVLMRLLGYEDADVGANWPQSYLSKAAAIGLTKGAAYSPLYVPTRGQTALILQNFVHLKTKDGGPNYLEQNEKNLTKQPGVLLLRDISGQAYFLNENGALMPDTLSFDKTLDGQAGDFVYDEYGVLLYFSPNADIRYETVSLREANDSHIVCADGAVVPVAQNTRVITYGGEDGTYGAVKADIRPGEALRLAYKGALLQYIYRDDEVFRQNARQVKTCLRFLQAGTQRLTVDDRGVSYLIRDTLDDSLEGQSGWLKIDAEEYAVSFTPDTAYSYQSVVAASAKAGVLQTADGKALTVTSAAPVLSALDSQTYGTAYAAIAEGELLTVATERKTGLTAYLYRHAPSDGGSGAKGTETVLRVLTVDGEPMAVTSSGLHPFTGSFAREQLGQFGTLFLDEEGNALSFTTKTGYRYQSITLKESQADGLLGEDDKSVTVFAATPVWDTDGAESTRYYDMWLELMPGEQLLLAYRPNGTLAYIYRGQTVSGENEGSVYTLQSIPEDGANPLTALFGTVTTTVVKNGCLSDYRSLEPYDLLEYYPAADLVLASNSRFLARLEEMPDFSGAKPRIRLSGRDFAITETAANKVLSLARGTRRLFLLDSKGQIADIAAPEAAPAFVSVNSEGIVLPNGLVLPVPTYTGGESAQGLLGTMVMRFSEYLLEPFNYTAAAHDWDIDGASLGAYSVAPWCEIYERGGKNGAAQRIRLSDIPTRTVPAANIKHVRLGKSGYVTALLLEDVTYDTYEYGIVRSGVMQLDSESGLGAEQNCVWVENGYAEGTMLPYGTALTGIRERLVYGLSPGRSPYTGDRFLGGGVKCNEYKDLNRYSFTADGYALIDGKKIPLAVDTVYLGDGQSVTLTYARANYQSITVYTDPANLKVRFITAGYIQ